LIILLSLNNAVYVLFDLLLSKANLCLSNIKSLSLLSKTSLVSIGCSWFLLLDSNLWIELWRLNLGCLKRNLLSSFMFCWFCLRSYIFLIGYYLHCTLLPFARLMLRLLFNCTRGYYLLFEVGTSCSCRKIRSIKSFLISRRYWKIILRINITLILAASRLTFILLSLFRKWWIFPWCFISSSLHLLLFRPFSWAHSSYNTSFCILFIMTPYRWRENIILRIFSSFLSWTNLPSNMEFLTEATLQLNCLIIICWCINNIVLNSLATFCYSKSFLCSHCLVSVTWRISICKRRLTYELFTNLVGVVLTKASLPLNCSIGLHALWRFRTGNVFIAFCHTDILNRTWFNQTTVRLEHIDSFESQKILRWGIIFRGTKYDLL